MALSVKILERKTDSEYLNCMGGGLRRLIGLKLHIRALHFVFCDSFDILPGVLDVDLSYVHWLCLRKPWSSAVY